jgi:hypothetical protein
MLLLFYIFLSHENEKKKMKKEGMLCPVHKYLWSDEDITLFSNFNLPCIQLPEKKIRVAPGKKQCTWAPSYTTTHRDKM